MSAWFGTGLPDPSLCARCNGPWSSSAAIIGWPSTTAHPADKYSYSWSMRPQHLRTNVLERSTRCASWSGSHWEPLGRCWNRLCSDWEMCIGHGIRVRRSMRLCFMNDKLPPEVGVVTVTWPKFKIWDPLHKFWADKDTRSKFCTVTYICWKNLTPKEAWLGSRDPLEQYLEPVYVFGVRNG